MSDHKVNRIYATNDFLPQFINSSTSVPTIVNFNSAKNAHKLALDALTDTIKVKGHGLYSIQFSLQIANVAFPPPSVPNPLVKFELTRNGGVLINSQTSFNVNLSDTTYVTSSLLSQYLDKGDKLQLRLSAPSPIPDGSLLRIDFVSITIVQIA